MSVSLIGSSTRKALYAASKEERGNLVMEWIWSIFMLVASVLTSGGLTIGQKEQIYRYGNNRSKSPGDSFRPTDPTRRGSNPTSDSVGNRPFLDQNRPEPLRF
ncbi:hypothetical protein I4U23_027096 [Adineta vaga]|nr:hypothetical protein I4U23_027096 [Adineta vaga]